MVLQRFVSLIGYLLPIPFPPAQHVLEKGSEIPAINLALLRANINYRLKTCYTAENVISSELGFSLFWFIPSCSCFSSFTPPLVFHPVECSYCHSESMMGFRYRCQQCHNYQLCQDCFWRGHAGGSHSNQHQMKEYTSWVRRGVGNTCSWSVAQNGRDQRGWLQN